MVRTVLILILIACIAECSTIKNSNNIVVADQDSTNQLQPTKVRSELDSENDIETEEELEAKKSLQEILFKLSKVLNSLEQQAEDIRIRGSKEQQSHIVSYCQFLF